MRFVFGPGDQRVAALKIKTKINDLRMSQIIFPTTLQTNGSECGTARHWSPAFRRRAAA
jgi:hypothetical protein